MEPFSGLDRSFNGNCGNRSVVSKHKTSVQIYRQPHLLRGIHENKPIWIGPAETDFMNGNRSAQQNLSNLLRDLLLLGRSLDRLFLMNAPQLCLLNGLHKLALAAAAA